MSVSGGSTEESRGVEGVPGTETAAVAAVEGLRLPASAKMPPRVSPVVSNLRAGDKGSSAGVFTAYKAADLTYHGMSSMFGRTTDSVKTSRSCFSIGLRIRLHLICVALTTGSTFCSGAPSKSVACRWSEERADVRSSSLARRKSRTRAGSRAEP